MANPKYKNKKNYKKQKLASKEESAVKAQNIFLRKPGLLLVLISILLYISTLGFDYTLDDTLMITKNELTQKGLSGLKDIFSSDAFVGFFGENKNLVAGGRYRPLTHAMFAIEHEFFGDSPLLGHLMNIISYALLSLLIFISLQALFKENTNKPFFSIAFIASLIFIIHPLHVEVVANIKGRDEIMSMGGAMAALLFSIRYFDTKKRKFLLFSFIVFFLALLSKENAITFLGIIPLSLFVFRETKWKDYIPIMTPVVAASMLFIIIRSSVLGQVVSTEIPQELLNNPFINATGTEEIATVIFTWLVYGKLLFFPHPLTHDYYPKQIPIIDFSDPRAIIPLILFTAILMFALIKIWKKNIYAYGILFFVFSFSIVSNLFFNIGTFMNERFMFVPLLGFAIIAAAFLQNLIKKEKSKKIAYVFLGFIFLAFSLKTISRSFAWQDNYTLFTTDVKTSTKSAKVNVSAAELILQKAEQEVDPMEKEKMLNEALVYLERAQKIHPNYFGAWDLTGKAAFLKKNYAYSLMAYQNCLKINPQAAVPLNNIYLIAQASQIDKQFDIAHRAINYLIERQENNLDYFLLKASLFVDENKIDTAILQYNKIIEQFPEHHLAYSKLGEIYGKILADYTQAKKYLELAYARNNQHLNTVENLGIVYGIMGKIDLSIKYLLEAEKIEPNNPRVLGNISTTYKMQGNTEKSLEYQKKAEEILTSQGKI